VTDNSTPAPSSSRQTPSATPSKTGDPTEEPTGPSGTAPTQAPKAPDLRSTACPAEIAPGTGASAACIKELQRLLVGWGLFVPVDGKFGASTVAAVKVFEIAAGATVDGKVGAYVKKLLYSEARGPVRAGTLTVTESVNAVAVARCLEAGLGSGVLDVEVWGCADKAAQKWALYRVPGQDAQYLVVNQDNHRCLDADAGTAGQNGQGVRVRTCDGSSAQRWRPGPSAVFGGRTLVSVPDGFCLDAEAETSGQDGQPVQGWSCAGSVNQVWNWS
jgi:peptidoglycan hydrolase-like protein with peptidoglycan-binding domain